MTDHDDDALLVENLQHEAWDAGTDGDSVEWFCREARDALLSRMTELRRRAETAEGERDGMARTLEAITPMVPAASQEEASHGEITGLWEELGVAPLPKISRILSTTLRERDEAVEKFAECFQVLRELTDRIAAQSGSDMIREMVDYGDDENGPLSRAYDYVTRILSSDR